MKTGDVLIAVATMAVVYALIAYFLDLAFVSGLGLVNGYSTSALVTMFISALFVGAVFAGKIQESRREAIAKITIVWGLLTYILVAIAQAYSEAGAYAPQYYAGQYGATLSQQQLVFWQLMLTDMISLEFVAFALVTGFIGLYVGSMLRKPKKN